jgi:hypothetical protein
MFIEKFGKDRGIFSDCKRKAEIMREKHVPQITQFIAECKKNERKH